METIIRTSAFFAAAILLSIASALAGTMLFGIAVTPLSWLAVAAGPIAVGLPAALFLTRRYAHYRVTYSALKKTRMDLEKANRTLRRRIEIDPMTGLLNRDYFFSALDRMRRRTDRGTMLIADADHFKAINDRFGHPAGDKALVAMTAAIARAVRENDLIGRLGGEEFAVFLFGATTTEARLVAERMREAVEQVRFEPVPGVVHPLTVSIGGVMTMGSATVADLMSEADKRLYVAKRSGRNRVVIEEQVCEAAA